MIRKTILSLGLFAAVLPAAFANSGVSFDSLGENGMRFHETKSTKTKAEVRAELDEARADGLLMGSGDGNDPWLRAENHSYAIRGGKLQHTDKLAHNRPKPSVGATAAERDLYRGGQ